MVIPLKEMAKQLAAPCFHVVKRDEMFNLITLMTLLSAEPYVYKGEQPDPSFATKMNVTVQCNTESIAEAYHFKIVALDVKNKEILLGKRLVYKPWHKNEKNIVYLEVPPKEAWVDGKMKVALQLIPVVEGRPIPAIDLEIVDIKFVLIKE